MRTVYELSDETRRVLADHVKDIATEMHCDASYLYQILSNVETDCYSKFLRLFAASVRAGADVSPWMDTLRATLLRNERSQTLCTHTEAAKLALESADVSAAFITQKDDQTQLREVRDVITQAKRTERALLEKISPTRMIAAEKVNGYRNGNGRR